MAPCESGSWLVFAAINNKGQVVLSYEPPQPPHAVHIFRNRGFIYDDGVVTDLDNLIDPAGVWHVDRASAMNDRGQIVVRASNWWLDDHGQWVGVGAKSNPRSAALLLTPVPSPQSTPQSPGAEQPAKPDTVSESKTVAEQPAKAG